MTTHRTGNKASTIKGLVTRVDIEGYNHLPNRRLVMDPANVVIGIVKVNLR